MNWTEANLTSTGYAMIQRLSPDNRRWLSSAKPADNWAVSLVEGGAFCYAPTFVEAVALASIEAQRGAHRVPA